MTTFSILALPDTCYQGIILNAMILIIIVSYNPQSTAHEQKTQNHYNCQKPCNSLYF